MYICMDVTRKAKYEGLIKTPWRLVSLKVALRLHDSFALIFSNRKVSNLMLIFAYRYITVRMIQFGSFLDVRHSVTATQMVSVYCESDG